MKQIKVKKKKLIRKKEIKVHTTKKSHNKYINRWMILMLRVQSMIFVEQIRSYKNNEGKELMDDKQKKERMILIIDFRVN